MFKSYQQGKSFPKIGHCHRQEIVDTKERFKFRIKFSEKKICDAEMKKRDGTTNRIFSI